MNGTQTQETDGLIPFERMSELMKFAVCAEYRPFSVLNGKGDPTWKYCTLFHGDGRWNVMPADYCVLYPYATFAR